MSQFNNIMSESIRQNSNNLTKVRIKIDPAEYKPGCDVNQLDEYTGYILQEFDDGTVSVFVPDAGLENPILQMLGQDINRGDAEDNKYSYLKELILKELPGKGVNDEDTKSSIQSSDCIHKLVDWMKQANFAEAEIIEVLKEYISETESGKQV
jgi:hypothetical protein